MGLGLGLGLEMTLDWTLEMTYFGDDFSVRYDTSFDGGLTLEAVGNGEPLKWRTFQWR